MQCCSSCGFGPTPFDRYSQTCAAFHHRSLCSADKKSCVHFPRCSTCACALAGSGAAAVRPEISKTAKPSPGSPCACRSRGRVVGSTIPAKGVESCRPEHSSVYARPKFPGGPPALSSRHSGGRSVAAACLYLAVRQPQSGRVNTMLAPQLLGIRE